MQLSRFLTPPNVAEALLLLSYDGGSEKVLLDIRVIHIDVIGISV
jgi:hypothetical protein